MKRRQFLQSTTAATLAGLLNGFDVRSEEQPACCDRTYATPEEAMASPPESLLYVPIIYTGDTPNQPDAMATVDVNPVSPTHGQVIHRLSMPSPGDELHHFGWNACSSCHFDPSRHRRFMVVPGIASGRIHILDTSDPREPTLHHVIEGSEIAGKVNLSAPHTVHCLADGTIMISMLGDAVGNGPGGFLVLDDQFNIVGRWERGTTGMKYNYDFWYQPRHNVMVSSEWGAPQTVSQGFRPDDVAAGKYGQQLHFWNWKERTIAQSVSLGETGLIPLEVRFHHNPDSTHGFVGAALSSTIWHWHKTDIGDWDVASVISVDAVERQGWPFPVPGLITDLVLSMDDRWLYFSNWLHGDIRQYDVSDPSRPKMTGQVWLGGVIGRQSDVPDREITGGPQMLQLSLDGKRLYVTSSLYGPWDRQFYPEMAERGSFLMQIDCDNTQGGLSVNREFYVDFGKEPNGPARAHEMRFPGGDSTSDIWV